MSNLFYLLALALCPQFIGGIYAFSAGGRTSLSPERRMFIDASAPAKIVMRVPKTDEDDNTVGEYYSWDRSESHIRNILTCT